MKKGGKKKERLDWWRVTDRGVSGKWERDRMTDLIEKKRKAIPQWKEVRRREDEGVRKDSWKEEGLCEARRAATTSCAYFMAATYHKSLSLMGERRSDDFKEITCRMRPTHTHSPAEPLNCFMPPLKLLPIHCSRAAAAAALTNCTFTSIPRNGGFCILIHLLSLVQYNVYKCGHKREAVVLKNVRAVAQCDGKQRLKPSNYPLGMWIGECDHRSCEGSESMDGKRKTELESFNL